MTWRQYEPHSIRVVFFEMCISKTKAGHFHFHLFKIENFQYQNAQITNEQKNKRIDNLLLDICCIWSTSPSRPKIRRKNISRAIDSIAWLWILINNLAKNVVSYFGKSRRRGVTKSEFTHQRASCECKPTCDTDWRDFCRGGAHDPPLCARQRAEEWALSNFPSSTLQSSSERGE